MNEAIIFDVGKLANSNIGTTESYNFSGSVELEGINALSDISGRVELMKIDDGFNVKLDGVEIKVGLECERCLKNYEKEVKIAGTERKFQLEAKEKVEDPNDQYFVDRKNMKIDLTELLRQEITLQFPLISVCSNGCKGICPKCGKDLNEGQCDCKEEKETGNKPLAILKDLIK